MAVFCGFQKRWPCKVELLPGEHPSSWLSRACWQNGIGQTSTNSLTDLLCFPVPWQTMDLDAGAAFTSFLRSAHDVGLAFLNRINISTSHPGPGRADVLRHPHHAMRVMPLILDLSAGSAWLQGGSSGRLTGRTNWMCFCPMCLAEDETPYLRMHWRIGFQSTCLRHGIILHDRCHICSAKILPWRQRSMFNPLEVAFDGKISRCWKCEVDLRSAPRMRAALPVLTFELVTIGTWLDAVQRRTNLPMIQEFSPLMARNVQVAARQAGILVDQVGRLTPAQRHRVYETGAPGLSLMMRIGVFGFRYLEERERIGGNYPSSRLPPVYAHLGNAKQPKGSFRGPVKPSRSWVRVRTEVRHQQVESASNAHESSATLPRVMLRGRRDYLEYPLLPSILSFVQGSRHESAHALSKDGRRSHALVAAALRDPAIVTEIQSRSAELWRRADARS